MSVNHRQYRHNQQKNTLTEGSTCPVYVKTLFRKIRRTVISWPVFSSALQAAELRNTSALKALLTNIARLDFVKYSIGTYNTS